MTEAQSAEVEAGSLRPIPTSIADLAPATYNPRRITDAAAAGLRASMSKFGDIAVMTWNRRTGCLVAGHQRTAQLDRSSRIENFRPAPDDVGTVGYAEVVPPAGPRFALRVVDWDEATERAANVAANSPHIAGEFTADLEGMLSAIVLDLPDVYESLNFKELESIAEKLTRNSLGPSTPEEFDEVDPEDATDHKCPKCGYGWNGEAT